jgi:hypothetical protein
MLAVLEPRIRPQRPQERLLKRVLRRRRSELSAQQAQHFVPMLLVEPFERRDHG